MLRGMKNLYLNWVVMWFALMLLLTSCLRWTQPIVQTATKDSASLPPIILVTDTQTLPTLTPTPTAIPSATPTLEPLGCQKPPEDYTRVAINGWILNQRTLAMLAHAQELYGGEQELTGYAITQGRFVFRVAEKITQIALCR